MIRLSLTTSLLALTAFATAPAYAQDAAPPATAQTEPAPADGDGAAQDGQDDADYQILVIADRVRGQVDTASAPVLELDEQQVASYGASSIADLVAQLAPEVGSGNGRGGRPVFLVNGQRITNFREIRRYPPEALARVEVLPEAVAVKYGYSPDQRVINFILKDNFASHEIEAEYGQPTRGGSGGTEVEGSILTINGPQRLNASVDWTEKTPLTEAERGVVQADGSVPSVATDPDPAAYRTLVARQSTLEANLTGTRTLGGEGSQTQLTLNAQAIHDVNTSMSGLDTVVLSYGGESALRTLDATPLTRRTVTNTYSLGSGINTLLGDFRYQSTVDASLTDTTSTIAKRRDTTGLVDAAEAGTLAIDGPLPAVPSAGYDTARSKVYAASNKNTLIGSIAHLPAGDVEATFDAGYSWNRIESDDTRTTFGRTTLTRGDLNGGVNLSLPIASRREGVLEAVGDLVFNLQGGLDHYSDFGTLANWNAGLTWKPTERLTLQSTYAERDTPPGLTQLGNPQIVNYNVSYYDLSAGQTVLITQTSGGNPNLVAETQRDLKLSASYDLDLLDRANVLVEYYRNRSDNVTSSFPLLTPAIEAAFPGRVTRDADGNLTAIDARPVTFAQTSSQRIRYGLNLFGRVGKASPETQDGGGGGRFGRPGAGAQPAAAPGPSGAGEGPPPGDGPPPGAGRTGGGQFDPQRFAEMRQKFCATPEGQLPDLSGVPERMLERLKGEDGQVDPAKVAALRERFCSADAPRRFDPGRFAAMRQALCADMTKDPDPAVLPQEVLDRLKGSDGTVSPEALREFRTRVCALPAPGQRQGGGESGGGGEGGRQQGDAQANNEGGGQNRGGGGGGGGRGGFGPGNGQGRWNIALYHTINLENSVLVAPGGPYLDLLNGDATGSGGVSRHQFELEGGMFYKGVGMRLSGTYNTGTDVKGSGVPGSSDLHFGGLATFNLRMFVALDQQKWLTGDNAGIWKNARLSLRVDNLFDAHQRVTDNTGTVPLRYQPALIDPVGRYVEIEFRKLF